MSWTASDDVLWLSVAPTSGTNGGTITVTPTTAGLSAGTYTATVTVTADGASGSPKTVPVMLTVDPPPPPALAVSPSSLTFNATVGGSNPARAERVGHNTGTGTLDVTASDDAAWLTVTPGHRDRARDAVGRAVISGLAAGTYTATVTVTATTSGATGSPKTVAVTLNVNPAVSANLVGAWGFDETSGTTATDASGKGNTGTITAATRSTAGKFGGALSFDGDNDWVTIPDANILDLTTGMTMEAWVRPSAVGSLWRAVMIKEQPSNLIYALYAGDGARPRRGEHLHDGRPRRDRHSGDARSTRGRTWPRPTTGRTCACTSTASRRRQARSRARSGRRPASCASAATASGTTSGSPG